jgi:hypothetical protein
VGGQFQSVNGNPASHFVRIDGDGSLNSSFQGTAEPPVFALSATAVGKILRVSQQTLARHLGDGSLDPTFTPVSAGGSSDDRFVAVASTAEGKAIVAGNFTRDGGATRTYVARFNPDGALDSSFTIAPDDMVRTVAVQPDGSIIIGGHFTTVNGVARAGIARIIAPSPVLQISAAGAGKVLLSWPTTPGFVLESCALNSANWSPVSEAMSTAGGRSCVTNSCSSGGRFYRLRSNR